MTILEVRDLTKNFGETKVIKGISFSMSEGEILGILGPNGAGKTTTIQMIIGTLTPTSGMIKVFGMDNQLHKHKIAEKLNFSSTYTRLPWWLTVKENLTWSSLLYQIDDRKKRLGKIKDTFRLEGLWDQKMYSLSAGQLTRVNIARSCLNYPRLLVLDEPTASLDPEVTAYIHEFLKNERQEFKTSIILTSHNMSEVEALCNRVLILKDGLVQAIGKPGDLAKKIERTKLALRITKNMVALEKLVRRHRLTLEQQDGVTLITLKEKILPLFLYELTKLNIQYSEISIDRPTLIDYFMAVAKDSV